MKKKRTEKSLKWRIFAVVIFSLFFGTLTGVFFAVMCGFFIPIVFVDWAGSFVCEGKMVFQSLQKTFQCYTSQTVFYDLGDKVFWTIFKIFLFPCVGVSSILLLTFFALTDSLLTKENEN